ncbi:MAG: hypothetical protein E7173_03270 [Firmicutes bacterium]|nr:hypothetical protein [Bacillota bacterium]
MEKIRFQDINLDALQRLSHQGATASVYRYDTTCIKILNHMCDDEREKLYGKLLDMDGLTIDNVILPKGLIIKDGELFGYWMDYFPNSKCLTDRFTTQYINTERLFQCIVKASYILREIHASGIICQDVSFENILVDVNGNVAFCDLDACIYKEHTSSIIPRLMCNFFYDYRNEVLSASQNMDRVAMLLSFYYLMYGEEIQYLPRRRYNRLSSDIETLENMKKYFCMLKNRRRSISEVPYLDELISSNDNYVLDREKQLTITNKIYRVQTRRYNY